MPQCSQLHDTHKHTQQFYSHYIDQPVSAGTPSLLLEDFAGRKLYCLHAQVADGNYHIWIREKILEFSSVVYLQSVCAMNAHSFNKH